MNKTRAVIFLFLVAIVLCGIQAAAQKPPSVTPATPALAREIVGGFPCEPERTHLVTLRVTSGSNTVQVDEANKSLAVNPGDCVQWKAVGDGKEPAVVAAIRFTGQAGKVRKPADVCDFARPGDQCLVAMNLETGRYTYVAWVRHGTAMKSSDALLLNPPPCFPPYCYPLPPTRPGTTTRPPVH